MRPKALLIAGALTVAGLASPVAAQASLSQCDTNHMCAWGNNDYGWLLANQNHGQGSWLDVFNDGTGENDETDSWANRSALYTGCLAEDVDGGGDRLIMGKTSSDPNLAFFNSDMVSAMRTKNGC